MALLIGYEPDPRRLLRAIELGWDDSHPDDVAFGLPDEAKKGDRVLYFVGGKFQYYFGQGTVMSNWRVAQSGPWNGQFYIWTTPMRDFTEPIPGQDVEVATGFQIPKAKGVVPADQENAVWRAARGKKLIQVERAMEGATTEARSKYRNAKLRESALQQARGVCEGCGVNYWKKSGGLGRHCLVVHHKKQMKDTDQPRETKLSELAVLCGNCHLLIHSNPAKALTITQLRRVLGK
jgi:hypothetical protein